MLCKEIEEQVCLVVFLKNTGYLDSMLMLEFGLYQKARCETTYKRALYSPVRLFGSRRSSVFFYVLILLCVFVGGRYNTRYISTGLSHA